MPTTVNTACIIDDDPIYVFGTKKIMQAANFCNNFIVFKNGKEAIDSLTPLLISGKKLPDIILLDINMPIMNGWQVLEEIEKLPTNNNAPIYLVSSSVDSRDIEKAKTYKSVSNYIVKPFSLDRLNELIEDIKKRN